MAAFLKCSIDCCLIFFILLGCHVQDQAPLLPALNMQPFAPIVVELLISQVEAAAAGVALARGMGASTALATQLLVGAEQASSYMSR